MLLRDSEVLEVPELRDGEDDTGPDVGGVDWRGGGLDSLECIPPSTIHPSMQDAPKNQGRKVPVPAVPDRL